MRQDDVEFIINAGESKGKRYRFTLAAKDGEKQWSVTPRFEPAPSIIKEKVEMVLTAREGNIPVSGAVELKLISKLLEQLRAISLEITPSTLIGLDKIERSVQVDEDGYTLVSTIREANKEPEYLINLTCWSLY